MPLDDMEIRRQSSASSHSRSRRPSTPSRGGNRIRADSSAVNSNFKVVIRVRPPLNYELHGERPFQNVVKVQNNRAIVISENLAAAGVTDDVQELDIENSVFSIHTFTFDYVYDQSSIQEEVYNNTARSAVLSTLQGYNASIIAYGQTGTGKTYTMEGFTDMAMVAGEFESDGRGIIPRSIDEIFDWIRSCAANKRFLVRASYLQIYNEVISDLLKPERTNLLIREDKRKGVYVEGLSEWVVRSPAEIYGLMKRGQSVRATGTTKMNEFSSRSHAVFMIICEQTAIELDEADGKASTSVKIGKLNLVDLAGSERVRVTGATGIRLQESKKINQSLSALGNVIAALTDAKGRPHIPYRDSKLTRILEDSIGGNCKTTMMAMISPALSCFNESVSTLKFANRAKNIKNNATINEDMNQKGLIRKYERELARLRRELEERNKNVVDKRRILELEEQKRRAEEDKLAAIHALEQRSREFMQEKLQKRKLEERIASMQSQLLGGEDSVQDTPAFRSALREEHDKMREMYDAKVADLERERVAIESDKAQVDRYKQLLLKQRDIMIALTARLNERDASILALQEELDAYDRHQIMMEDALDQKTAMLIHLQRLTMEMHKANSGLNLPVPNMEEALSAINAGIPPERHTTTAGVVNGIDGGEMSAASIAALTASAAKSGGSGNVAPSSVKRYEPVHQDQIVFDAKMPHTSQQGLLSAEEKIDELNSLIKDQRLDSEQLLKELDEIRSEKVNLETLLREKLEKMVQTEIEERLAAFDSTNEPTSRRAAYENMLQMANGHSTSSPHNRRRGGDMGGGGDERDPALAGKVAAMVQSEVAQLHQPLQQQVQSLQRSLRSAENERELLEDHLSAKNADLEAMRDQVRRLKSKLAASQSQQGEAKTGAAGARTGGNFVQLEHRIDVLKTQHAQYRSEVSSQLDDKANQLRKLEDENRRLRHERTIGALTEDPEQRQLWQAESEIQQREIRRLQGQNDTHQKERAALKTILEAKIKTLVDAIADAQVNNRPITRETATLQKLVNASIAALKSSDPSRQR